MIPQHLMPRPTLFNISITFFLKYKIIKNWSYPQKYFHLLSAYTIAVILSPTKNLIEILRWYPQDDTLS